jgi:NADPH:quinone reductase-like Zn-dependent oxidoreductase
MGHEGAGVITEVGPEVTNHKVGDRVAWGWVRLLSFSILKFSLASLKHSDNYNNRSMVPAAIAPPVKQAT